MAATWVLTKREGEGHLHSCPWSVPQPADASTGVGGAQLRYESSPCHVFLSEKPRQVRTGSRGYFVNRGSVADSWHRQKTEPRSDSTRCECLQLTQRPTLESRLPGFRSSLIAWLLRGSPLAEQA